MTKKNNQPKSKFFTSVLNYFMRKKNNSSTEEEVSTIKPEDDKSFLDYYSKSLVYRDKFLIDSKSKRIPEIINYSVNDNTDISPLFKIESILDKLTKTITNLLQTGNSTKLSKQINNINNITNIKKIPIFSYRNESDNFKYLPVPSFAEGGMASQPTLAIVGDS